MGFFLFDLLEDAGTHGKTIAGWVNTRRSGQGTDFRQDEFKEQAVRAAASLHPRRMQLRLTEVLDETASIKTLRFERTDGALPPFRAGQYLSLAVEIDGVHTSRPYSISSVPGADHLDLTIRRVEGGFVSPYLLDQLKPGAELTSTGPQGSFVYEPLIDGDDLVFLAGGCGVTPFVSLIRQAAADDWPVSITLLYGCRRADDGPFRTELDQLAEASDRFRWDLVLSEPDADHDGPAGFLDAERIGALLTRVDGRSYYVCGPQPMQELCIPALEELGVPRQRIRRELPGPPQDVTREPGWPEGLTAADTFAVKIGDRTIPAAAGEPLLCALERHHIVTPAICRSGECSACRTRLLSGEIYAPPQAHVRESDRAHGFIHACVAYPISDLEIRL